MMSVHHQLLIALLATFLVYRAVAFVPVQTQIHTVLFSPSIQSNNHVLFSSKSKDDTVEITFPTPDEAASMGIRDWPQTFHATSWTESVSEGQIATRYVLDGKGRVSIQYFDNNGRESSRNDRVYPGTLIEVDGEATLRWDVEGKEGMIILTPGFEEGGKLALVLGFFVVFCAGLLAGSGGF
jgi:hypothetical protein